MVIIYILVGLFLMGSLLGGKCFLRCGNIGYLSSYGNRLCTDRSFNPSHAIAYNIGRIVGYTIVGSISAFLGALFFHFFMQTPAWMGAALLIASGFMFIVVGLYLVGWNGLLIPFEKISALLWKFIRKRVARRFLALEHVGHAFALGCLWTSPCSIIFVIACVAFFSASPAIGSLMMLAFGLGTFPNMLLISWGMPFLEKWRSQKWFQYTSGFLLIIWGLMVLLMMSVR